MPLIQLQGKLQKNSRNTIFKRKQTTNKAPPDIFAGFTARKKVRVMFSRPKDSMKGKCYVFSGYKQKNKVRFVNLDYKLEHDMYR